MCGCIFTPDVCSLRWKVSTRLRMTCLSPVESSHYGAKCIVAKIFMLSLGQISLQTKNRRKVLRQSQHCVMLVKYFVKIVLEEVYIVAASQAMKKLTNLQAYDFTHSFVERIFSTSWKETLKVSVGQLFSTFQQCFLK